MYDAFVDGHADMALAASIFYSGEYSEGMLRNFQWKKAFL